MEHIYIRDEKNSTYDHMANLGEAVANLINSNVCKMQEANMRVYVCSADSCDNGDYAKHFNLEWDQDLYDKLILEYNSLHPNAILERWARHK